MPQPAWVAGRLQKESAVSRFFYNTILKRSSTYMTAVMIMATATGAHACWRRAAPAAAPPLSRAGRAAPPFSACLSHALGCRPTCAQALATTMR